MTIYDYSDPTYEDLKVFIFKFINFFIYFFRSTSKNVLGLT